MRRGAKLTRRAALFLPLLLASCGDDEPQAPRRVNFPPLRYGFLPPIPLNVRRVEMMDGFIPPTGDGEIIGTSPIDPVATLFAMARDRLKPVAAGGTARFSILTTSIIRHGDTLNGNLAVRLDVRDAEDTNSGFAEARVSANHAGSIPDQSDAVYDMLKSMMEQMNVELEFQIRQQLRSWIAGAPTETPPPKPQRVDPSTSGPPPPETPPRD